MGGKFSINGTVGLAHAGEQVNEALALVLLNNVQTLCLPFPVKGEQSKILSSLREESENHNMVRRGENSIFVLNPCQIILMRFAVSST